ncbi:MAG: hydrolase [Betaproteobacteria bacterium]|nr:hydrolase [Betaproteobacteria bacterium]MBI3055913.1 hydrolase [Betaproteobacteria bacterium]
MNAYLAPAWLPGGHLQTIYPALAAPRPRVSYQRERWDTPDGDFIDLDWLDDRDSAKPLVVLFHGLEGGSRSHYAAALMAALRNAGWRGVVIHFRGCSGEINRLRRAYHSGDSAEIDWILKRLKQRHAAADLFAVGVSLGGNALLKWLGERGTATADAVAAAAAVSAPVDLTAAGNALDAGTNLIYTRNFLASMKGKTLAKLERFPDLCDRKRVLRARTLRAFDDIVTAPLHGYRDTGDYWLRASSKPLLRRIVVPTLMINARNDPFLPAHALPLPHEVSSAVSLELPASGGHAGFVSGAFPGHLDWLPQRVLDYFARHRVHQDGQQPAQT